MLIFPVKPEMGGLIGGIIPQSKPPIIKARVTLRRSTTTKQKDGTNGFRSGRQWTALWWKKMWANMFYPFFIFPDTGPKPREARPLDQFQVATWGI